MIVNYSAMEAKVSRHEQEYFEKAKADIQNALESEYCFKEFDINITRSDIVTQAIEQDCLDDVFQRAHQYQKNGLQAAKVTYSDRIAIEMQKAIDYLAEYHADDLAQQRMQQVLDDAAESLFDGM